MAVAYRIYADALFEAAKDRDRLRQVREELGDFVAMLDEVPELRNVLRNPQLDPTTKARILEDVLGEADELVRNFVRLLAEKGRAGQLGPIYQEFERLLARQERRLNVELTTAVELPDDDLGDIIRQIEQASGRTVEATTTVDPDLIGGLVLKVGTHRVDASVRGRLERLRRELARSA